MSQSHKPFGLNTSITPIMPVLPHLWIKYLYPRVPPIRHEDVVLLVHSDPGGSVELAVAFAVRAETELELAGGIEHLEI